MPRIRIYARHGFDRLYVNFGDGLLNVEICAFSLPGQCWDKFRFPIGLFCPFILLFRNVLQLINYDMCVACSVDSLHYSTSRTCMSSKIVLLLRSVGFFVRDFGPGPCLTSPITCARMASNGSFQETMVIDRQMITVIWDSHAKREDVWKFSSFYYGHDSFKDIILLIAEERVTSISTTSVRAS